MVLLLSGRRLLLEFNENILPVKTLALIWWILVQWLLYWTSAIFKTCVVRFIYVFFFLFSFLSFVTKDSKPLGFCYRCVLGDPRTCVFQLLPQLWASGAKEPMLEFLLWIVSWFLPLQWWGSTTSLWWCSHASHFYQPCCFLSSIVWGEK